MIALLLAVTLCDPCSRDYPLGCEGDQCRELSATPVLDCLEVQRENLYETQAQGARLYWRYAEFPLPAWAAIDIPFNVVQLDGVDTVFMAGLTPVGEKHPDDPMHYRRSTLPVHRHIEAVAGAVVHVGVSPYNAAGAWEPDDDQPCASADDCELCRYATICWYPVWEIPSDPPMDCSEMRAARAPRKWLGPGR